MMRDIQKPRIPRENGQKQTNAAGAAKLQNIGEMICFHSPGALLYNVQSPDRGHNLLIPSHMKTSRAKKGFTLIELLVVIGIIALLASIAVPAYITVQIKAKQSKALANARGIGLACQTYAIDNNGAYPSFVMTNGSTSTTVVSYSNQAFDNLFPAYLQTIKPFYQSGSAFTPTLQGDPNQQEMADGNALPVNTNEWAYVTGLYNTSNSSFPLIADGFYDVGSHAYTNAETARGGVWKGQSAIVIFCDCSAQVLRTNPTSYIIPGSPTGNDLFNTSGGSNGGTDWLTGPSGGGGGNTVVNPQ
jgi:prepilin-type N-terminal cleavage/methylation domain-containing protein